jgi:hypothetical protein
MPKKVNLVKGLFLSFLHLLAGKLKFEDADISFPPILIMMYTMPNFKAPDIKRTNVSGGPDINRTYKKPMLTPLGIALQTEKKTRNKNSERFDRNAVLLTQPQTFGLYQLFQHINSSEF